MPILEFIDVSKVLKSGITHRPVYRLGPLSFAVEAGEIFGYLGPNGAGKTTSIKILMGLLRPDSGQVRVFGKPANQATVKTGMGFLPERPYFYQHLSAFELLDFYGELFGLSARERRERAMSLLDMTGLGTSADTRLHKFSKGMLQRVGFAQALINDPEVIVLDEPLSGLDPTGRRQIRDLILDLRAGGKTVFFSSHILQDVEMICDRVGILHEGKLQSTATMKEVLSETVHAVEILVEGMAPDEVRRLGIGNPEEKAGRVVIRLGPHDDLKGAIEMIVGAGGSIASVVPQRRTLEDYFVRNIGSGRPAQEAQEPRREKPLAGIGANSQ